MHINANRRRTIFISHTAFVVIGIVVGLITRVTPVQASVESVGVDAMFNFMLAIATVIFLIVEFWIVYAMILFRAKPGDNTDGPADHGNSTLEITWTAIPAVIVFGLALMSYQLFVDIRTPKDGEIPILVTGQQFKWSFKYVMPADDDPKLTDQLRQQIDSYMVSNELHVPIGHPVRADIKSTDVMHGFFIPEFRIKQDAIPNRTTSAYFTPAEKGIFWVECSELCGANHAGMSQINEVFVQDPADYANFVSDLYASAKKAATDPTSAAVGKQLMINKYPCGGCHILDDAGLKGTTGPALNGIAIRAQQHADKQEGILGADTAEGYIRTSIINPNYYIVAGYQPNLMPQNFGDPTAMPKNDQDAIVNYLMTQK